MLKFMGQFEDFTIVAERGKEEWKIEVREGDQVNFEVIYCTDDQMTALMFLCFGGDEGLAEMASSPDDHVAAANSKVISRAYNMVEPLFVDKPHARFIP